MIAAAPVSNLRTSLWRHQREAFSFALDRPATLLAMAMGPQPLSAAVLTPDGWTTMGDLRPGDRVIGGDGQPTRVLETFDLGEREVFRVTLSDGSSTRCTDDHLWVVNTPRRKQFARPPIVLPLAAFRNRLRNSQGNRQWFIPMVRPIRFGCPAPAVIPPYTLGVLLGDGSLTTSVQWSKPDDEIVSFVRAEATSKVTVATLAQPDLHSISTPAGQPNPYRRELRRLGLFPSTSHTKFIPPAYLFADPDDRLALLQGLMDTDGHCTPESNSPEYCTVSDRLADDVVFLVRSLGGRATKFRKDTYTGGAWRISISLPSPFVPFRLARKADRYLPKTKYQPTRCFERVEPDGRERVRCIRVEAEHGTYVTDDLIVTHNTGKSATTIALLDAWDARATLILCPKSVVSVWPDQFARHLVQPPAVLALDHGTVAARVAQARTALAQSGPVVLVVNYEAAIQPQMAHLLKGRLWDAVVLDESHRVKDHRGVTSRLCRDLARRARRRLCLTGTPMPHSPLDVFAQARFLDARVFGTSWLMFRNRYAQTHPMFPSKVLRYQHLDELEAKLGTLAYRVGADALDLPEATHVTRTCALSPQARRVYRDLEQEFTATLEAFGTGDQSVTASNVLTRLLRCQQVASGFVRDDDGTEVIVDHGKQHLFSDVLADLDPSEDVVAFCRFRHDLAMVRAVAEQHGRPAYELSGRANDLATWQREGGVLAVQLQAGGVGIDLTRARVCVYVSKDFSLGTYDQSLARVHRPGQTRPVLYVHLLATDTVDVDIERALSQRRDLVESLLEGLRR